MKKTDLSKFSIGNYNHGSFLKRISWFFCNAIFLDSNLMVPMGLKIQLLKLFGAKIQKGVVIKPKVNIKYPWNLEIGENTWIGEGVWIDNLAMVQIGDNVCVSQGAFLLTGNHDFKKTTFDLMVGEIKLEDGVWIGAKAIVCPSVVCKSHSVLSVGSVTSQNLEAYSIYRGNPAVKVKERIVD